MSDDHPIEFESGLPNPTRIPSAPDELLAHIRQYHRGLDRVTIKLYTGRKRMRQINAIHVGAKQGELPRAGIEVICRAIMAVCGDLHEETAQDARFQIQAHVWLGGTEPQRKSCQVELGDGGEVEGNYQDSDKQLDTVLISHLQVCQDKVIELAGTVAEIGKVAIENASSIFKAREDAMQARAEAESAIAAMNLERDANAARNQRMNKLLEMFGGALKSGTGQVAAHIAGKVAQSPGLMQAVGLSGPALAPLPSPAPDSPPAPFSAPSWVTGASPSPSPSASDTTDVVTEIPDQAWAEVARTIGTTISNEQWFALVEILSKTQIKILRKLAEAQTDDDAFVGVREFQAKLKPDQHMKLLKAISADQIGLLIDLQSAAESAAAEA